jgi:hypothetical protein
MGMLVRMKGRLSGLGRESDCEVVALREPAAPIAVASRFAPQFVYADLGVIQAPGDLPDGQYTVSVGSQTFQTLKRQGIWHSCAIGSRPQGAGMSSH